MRLWALSHKLGDNALNAGSALPHWPCIRVSKCSAGAPVTARPSRSRQKQNDPRKLHWFTSNVGTAHLTDHHGWNREAIPCPVVYKLVSCTPHKQHFHFWFRHFAGKIALRSSVVFEESENVDCEVYKKPDVMKFIHHRTRESFPVRTMMIC